MAQKRLPFSETELLSGLLANCPAAFTYLYDRYGRVLLGHIQTMIPNHGLAEDVLQNVFVKIHLRVPSYDPLKSQLFTWMMAVTRNECRDVLRSRGYRDHVQLTEGLSEACFAQAQAHEPYQRLDAQELQRVVQDLPLGTRNLVALSYLYGFSHREIAELLALPLGTVKTNLRKAYRCLRERLEAQAYACDPRG